MAAEASDKTADSQLISALCKPNDREANHASDPEA
jgi:hypothetical protein